MKDLEVRFLKRLSRKIRQAELNGESLNNIELDYCYDNITTSDAYHAKLKHRSIYCSMGDVKDYLQKERPDLNFNCWSMKGYAPDTDRTIFINGETIILKHETIKKLERVHIDEGWYEQVLSIERIERSWEDEWMDEFLPCYLDEKLVKRLLIKRMEHAKSKLRSQEESDDIFSKYEYSSGNSDIFGFLIDSLAYSRAMKCAAWVRLCE